MDSSCTKRVSRGAERIFSDCPNFVQASSIEELAIDVAPVSVDAFEAAALVQFVRASADAVAGDEFDKRRIVRWRLRRDDAQADPFRRWRLRQIEIIRPRIGAPSSLQVIRETQYVGAVT